MEILQEGLKSALCDCWPEPGDDFDRVLSRTRACDKDLWGSPACGEDGPLASSQAPSLATNGDAAKMSQKENLGPLSSIPLSVAAALPKLKVPAPPRGPRGPGLLKAAKDQDQVNPSASLGTKPKGNTSRMPPPTAIGRKQLSDRIPKAPVPPRPAPRPVRQLDTKADALAALQAAEQ